MPWLSHIASSCLLLLCWGFCMHVCLYTSCVLVPLEARIGYRILWDWSSRRMPAAMWVLELELGSSGPWTIPPAPNSYLWSTGVENIKEISFQCWKCLLLFFIRNSLNLKTLRNRKRRIYRPEWNLWNLKPDNLNLKQKTMLTRVSTMLFSS